MNNGKILLGLLLFGFLVGVSFSAPSVVFNYPSNNTYYNTDINLVNVTVTDANGVDTVIAEVNSSGTLTNYTLSKDGTTDYYYNDSLGLTSEGNYTIRIYANNSNGDINSSEFVVIGIDKTAPTFVSSDPANNSYIKQTIPTLVIHATDSLSGIKVCVFHHGTSELNETSCTKQISWATSDGTYTIPVSIYDNAGNHKDVNITFTVDTTPPTLSITSPANNSYTNQSSVTITWTGSDSLSGIAYYNISRDGGSWENLSTTTSKTYTLSDGSHTVTVIAVDNAGNTKVSSITFTVDTTPPTLSITSPANNSYTNQPHIGVTWTGSDENLDYYNFSIDNGGWINAGTNTTLSVDFVYDGHHSISVLAVDKAGNTRKETLYITLDTTPPYIQVNNPIVVGDPSSTNFEVSINVSENNPKEVLFNISNSLAHLMYTVDNHTWVYTLSSIGNITSNLFGPGIHNISFTATDLAGNTETVNTTLLIKIVSLQSLRNFFNSQGIHANVTDINGAPVTTPAIAPTEQNYNYIFEKNSFTVEIYNVSVNESKLPEMTNVNLTLDLQSIVDKVENMSTNLSQISAVWAEFPWADATDYSYGKVVMNSTYDALYYCNTTDNCVKIDECNASEINYTNYQTVIPTDGACYINENGHTVVYVDHFSGVVGARDAVPPTISMECNKDSVYVNGRIDCSVNVTDNLALKKLVCGNKEIDLSGTNYIYNFTADTSKTGTHEVSCTVYDTAMNNATASKTYKVKHRMIGGSGQSVNVPPHFDIIFDKINKSAEFKVSNLDITKMKIEVKGVIENPEIKIIKLTDVNIGKPKGKVYTYIEIQPTNLNDDEINKVVISFKVSKQWLIENNVSKENVVLMRYHNGWTKLTTVESSEDNDYVYYKAETPGFSYYAITAFESENATETTTNTTNGSTSEVPNHQIPHSNASQGTVENGTVSTQPNQDYTMAGILAGVVVVLAAGIGYYIFKRRK